MMAAISAAELPDHRVILLEKNEKLGKKLYITGKGRGNFTNSAERDVFLANVVSNPRFLYASFHRFSNQALLSFMEEWGCKWKEERGGRIFPVSDHASDITKALEKALKHHLVEVRLNTKVDALLTMKTRGSENKKMAVKGVRLQGGETLLAERVIVATGGASYPTTGSTGDGWKFAKEADLTVVEPVPALVPLETQEEDIYSLQGLSLKNVTLTVSDTKKKLYDGFGEMLFTHFGVSGPLVLSASSVLARRIAQKEALYASIDLKPAIMDKELDERLLTIISENRRKAFSHFFDGLIPQKMRSVMVNRSGVSPENRIGDLSKEDRKRIRRLLKDFSFTISRTRGFSEAIITQGGVSVKELDPKTMRSKRCEGLSFAGEVIDLDAFTGGFNLQIAFSTGFLAGYGVDDA